ncbi:MAG: hypothetical protein H6559_37905 [Lewinellaceae bacterium]|nr:hypothetical protein [Lewinellaceae bacterium]
MFYSDGSRYEGSGTNNKRHGSGVMSFDDGEVIAGEWQGGQYLTDWSKYAFALRYSQPPQLQPGFCGDGTANTPTATVPSTSANF